MTVGSPQELIRLIIDRPGLFDVFEADSFDRNDIKTRLGVSRSTTHRLVRKLSDSGVIDRTNGEYRVTELGSIVIAEVRRSVQSIDTALTLNPLLQAANDNGVDIELELFTDATVIQDEGGDSSRIETHLIDCIEDADEIRNASETIISHRYIATLLERMNDGATLEFVSTKDAIDFVSTAHPAAREYCHNEESPRIFRNDEVAITVIIAGDRACLGVSNPTVPHLDLLVSTTNPQSVDWAESIYESIRSEATPYRPDTGEH